VGTTEGPPPSRMILDPDNDRTSSAVQMWTRYVLETGGSDPEPLTWLFNVGDAFDPNLNLLYAKIMLAEEPAAIEPMLSRFQGLAAELREAVMALDEPEPFNDEYLDRVAVIGLQLQARLAKTRGETATALALAGQASQLEGEMPYAFGPPFVDYPSAQLLGELALEMGDYKLAVEAFSEQLKRSRGRRQALAGLQQAKAKANAK